MTAGENSKMLLFAPGTIGGQELKSRIVMAPMTRARCTPTSDPLNPSNTNPNDLMAEYYAQRSSCGLIVAESAAISEMGSGWLNSPHIRTAENVAGWKVVTDRVHDAGGIIYLQLWRMGRLSHSSFHPNSGIIVSASALSCKDPKARTASGEDVEFETPHALSAEEIGETVQDYVRATRLAKKAGFDGVEILGSNGYLIDQFLQSVSNVRDDEYGGSAENRVRFLKDILEALIADGAFPAGRIGLRLSPNGSFHSMGSSDNAKVFPKFAKALSGYGLAYLHVLDGLSLGAHGKCRPVSAHEMKAAFKGPIMANVGLTRDLAEGMLRSGAVDYACFGRPYISNPDLPERYLNDWPLNPDAEYRTWYQSLGAEGYTDFPFYSKTLS